jgi:hypothetical protein
MACDENFQMVSSCAACDHEFRPEATGLVYALDASGHYRLYACFTSNRRIWSSMYSRLVQFRLRGRTQLASPARYGTSQDAQSLLNRVFKRTLAKAVVPSATRFHPCATA